MKKTWRNIGIVIFWVSWPLIFVYLARSRRARVLVSTDDKVLLVRSWIGRGTWELPGGGMRRGERPEQAGARELHEETGLQIAPDDLSYLFEHKSGLFHGGVVRHCLQVQLSKEKPVKANAPEISEAVWVPIAKLDKLPLEKASRTMVQAWLEHHKLLQ